MKKIWAWVCANVCCPIWFVSILVMALIALSFSNVYLSLLVLLSIPAWLFVRKNVSFTYFTITRPLFFKKHYWISQSTLPFQNIGRCPDKTLTHDFVAIAKHIRRHPHATYHTYTHSEVIDGISSFCEIRPTSTTYIRKKDLRFIRALINQSRCKNCDQNGHCNFTKYSCYKKDSSGNFIFDENGKKELNKESFYAVIIHPDDKKTH